VFLDIFTRRSAADIKRKLPAMYHQFKELGDVDITREAMEVGPTAHYTMGGVRVNPDTQETCVRGLFAAGECAAGMHGSNRLGGNSLSDLLVFGRIAGEHAARAARDAPAPAVNDDAVEAASREALAPFERETGANPFAVHEDLKEQMQRYVGIIRVKEDLDEGLKHLERLKALAATVRVEGPRHYNAAWHQALDVRNMLVVSEAMARAALHREESRGAHTREDFPEQDKGRWSKVNVVLRRKDDGGMDLAEVPLPEYPADIQAVLDEG
jgi:succinate dehydrogenase / fumarate reductase flavoprotein subunit